MAPTSQFATQLSRHPGLRPIGRETMYARHPSKTDATGRKYVPAVHVDPRRGPSIFLYPGTKYGYDDRLLADGVTIEYHPSRNALITSDIDSLVGKDVILYAQLGRFECVEGRVRVSQQSAKVYHLRILRQESAAARTAAAPAPAPGTAAPRVLTTEPPAAGGGSGAKVSWADMIDESP